MKKTLFTLLFSILGLCTFAAINTIKIVNNSSCDIYVKPYADQVMAGCASIYEADWVFLPAGTAQNLFPNTMTWITSPAAIGYGIWWTSFKVSNDPGCTSSGPGASACPMTDEITLNGCPTLAPVNDCFTITNNCNVCPPTTKVGVNISIVSSVTYVEIF